MKKVIPVIILLLTSYNFSHSNTVSPLKGSIISKEVKSNSGKIKAELSLTAYDTVFVKDLKFSKHRHHARHGIWCGGIPPFLQYKQLLPGESMSFWFEVNYDRMDRPFYPQEVNIEIEYYKPENIQVNRPPKNPHHGNVLGETERTNIKGMIYFTPYGSIELWDIADFHNLKRVWLSETDPQPDRKQVSAKSIPTSDLDDSMNPALNPWQDDWNLVFVEGLAYAVPMKRKNKSNMPEKGKTALLNYNYRINGTVSSSLIDDIDMRGLELRFYDSDYHEGGLTDDEYLGKTILQEDGSFSFEFNLQQPFAREGRQLELYFTILANLPEQDIKAKTDFGKTGSPSFTRRGAAGIIRLDPTAGQQDVSISVSVFDDSHHAVLFAGQALEFCQDNFLNVAGGVTLWPYSQINPSSFYLPAWETGMIGGFTPVNGNGAAIYLDGNHSGDQEVVFHEFGHHVMYSLQDQKTIDPAAFVYYRKDCEENAHIAWTEGWANGFLAICNMANGITRSIDDENWEQNIVHPEVTRGFNNIDYIGRAIFDLFDGKDKMINGADPGWTFEDQWTDASDVASFTLEQICLPLADRVPDAASYFRQLMITLDCDGKKSAKSVFDNNLVGIAAFDSLVAGLSSDGIGIMEDNSFPIDADDIWHTGRIEKLLNAEVFVDIVSIEDKSFNVADLQEYFMADPVTVGGSASLVFNGGMNAGIFVDGTSAAQRAPIDAQLCRGTRYTATDGGAIVIGDPETGNKAVIHLGNESLLTIEAGGKLIVNDGSELVVEAGGTLLLGEGSEVALLGESSITIKEGGYICVAASAQITLTDHNSLIVTDPLLIVGTNPVLQTPGSCLSIEDINFTGNGKITGQNPPPAALLFDGKDDRVTVENVDPLNFSYNDFTMEVRFKSGISDSTLLHQIILSKRSNDIYKTTDGFLLGLWASGQDAGKVLLQLANVPNHLKGPNLFDNQCHHIVLIRESAMVSFFIDGVFYGEVYSGRNISSPTSLFIGYDKPTRLGFDGFISDVRLWNRALTTDEIDWSLSPVAANDHEGLVAHWKTDGEPGQLIPEQSGSGIAAILGDTQQAEASDPSWETLTCNLQNARLASATFMMDTQNKMAVKAVNPYDSVAYYQEVDILDAYPNPFEDQLNIRVTTPDDCQLTLVITDIYGNEVYRSDNLRTNETTTINQQWEKGVYIVTAIYGNRVKEIKTMKLL